MGVEPEPKQPTVLGSVFGLLSNLFCKSSPDEEPASRVGDIESEAVRENADAAVSRTDPDETLRWIAVGSNTGSRANYTNNCKNG